MGAMGIDDPTANPEETLYQFSLITKKTLDSIETPAIYRTWIQGYGDLVLMKWLLRSMVLKKPVIKVTWYGLQW